MKDSIAKFSDGRGDLIALHLNDITFEPKRLFYVTNVPCGMKRGDHSHYNTQQLLICIKGRIEVNLHDGNKWESTILTEHESIFVDRLVWDNQVFHTEDSMLLVLCSTEFDKSDYILDFDKFKELSKITV
jgi:dTDP-4-dehydrorhamnose 3,5-epimerase-like enzyme